MKETKTNVPLWSFYYKVGPAPKFGTVEASDERTAVLVAAKWCLKNGIRPPASVQPQILANESILLEKVGEPETEPLMDAVAATTGVNQK